MTIWIKVFSLDSTVIAQQIVEPIQQMLTKDEDSRFRKAVLHYYPVKVLSGHDLIEVTTDTEAERLANHLRKLKRENGWIHSIHVHGPHSVLIR